MRPTITLRLEHLRLVQAILRNHVPDQEVRAFGSRVTGNAKPMSDLDLCLMGPSVVDARTLEKIEHAFSESTLPYKVDVVLWPNLPEALRATIATHSVVVQQGKSR